MIKKLQPRIVQIERYSSSAATSFDKSLFFAPEHEADEGYGEILTVKYVDERTLWFGENSRSFLIDHPLWRKKDSYVKQITGLDSLYEVQEAYRDNPRYSSRMSAAFNHNPNIYFYMMQVKAAEILEKKGYPGARWDYEDDLTPRQYQIWDTSILMDHP